MRSAALVLLVLAASCATPPAPAPEAKAFAHVSREDVQGAMGRIARAAFAVNTMLRDEAAMQRASQEQIVQLLGEIDEAAASIDSAGRQTNHPLIDNNLPTFRGTIGYARAQAARTPPNYYVAGKLIGACTGCHADLEGSSLVRPME